MSSTSTFVSDVEFSVKKEHNGGVIVNRPNGGFPPIYLLKSYKLSQKIKKREYVENIAPIGEILQTIQNTPFIGGNSVSSSEHYDINTKSHDLIAYDSFKF